MKNKINLIPKELLKKEGKFPSLSGANQKLIVRVILIIAAVKIIAFASVTKTKSDLKRINSELGSYAQKISQIETTVKTDISSRQEKIDAIKSLVSEREKEIKDFGIVADPALKKDKFVYDLFSLIARNIPKEIWIDEVGFDIDKGEFYLSGSSLLYPEIGTFLKKLGEFSYLSNLYMNHSETMAEKTSNRNVVKFQASGKINL